ncbi:N-acylneuraminate cytidylyltransferase [Candidatus Magnetomorum sp. HK-1]|nr:N-acylneuraminate cytidylyltransferase [Candidatus Magnetomorum sp. HK-1]
MNTITIIPARGGSKGIPDKNIINFCGKPLLEWSILQAQKAQKTKDIFVSSDSKQILNIAEKCGAIPILRPDNLSTDTATSEFALLHTLNTVEKKRMYEVDLIVFLQATSPLREPEDIDQAIEKLLDIKADSLFSASLVEDLCLWEKKDNILKALTFDPDNRGRRQDRQPLYIENGSIYLFRPDILRKFNNRLGEKTDIFLMPYWKSFEIDNFMDLELCEYYFKKKLFDKWKHKF